MYSTDEEGVIEVWDPETYELPEEESRIGYEVLSDTDYYTLAQNGTYALAMTFTRDGKRLAIMSTDRKIRVFDTFTGKLQKTFSETLDSTAKLQEEGHELVKLDPQEFEKKLANEKDIDKALTTD